MGLKSEDNEIVEGYVTNGVEGCFVTLVNGEIHEEDFIEINEFALDRIIQNILSLKLLAFNASNLVDSFCNPPENNGVAYELVRCLYNVLIENIKPKTKMLFIEWKQLFNLAHDDISKQQAIIDRKNHWKNCWVINFQIEMTSIYLYTHFKQLMPLLLKQ